MEMARGMRIGEAKKYVAEKLGVSTRDLADPVIMNELRSDLNIGTVFQLPEMAKGIEPKFRIADLLEIKINSVEKFKERAGLRI